MAPRARLSSLSSSRTGRMPAAVASRRRSLPLKPSAPLATASSDTSSPSRSPLRMARRISTRAPVSGRSQKTRRLKRRSTASSRSHGRLVAASTSTCASLCVMKPSHSCMNSVFMLVMASCSMPVRLPSIASISSMKMMQGCSFQASVNSAVTSFWVSPSHLLWMELARMFTNRAPDSFAMALASMVLPVPGGPYSSTPLLGFSSGEPENRCGRCSGAITLLCRASTMALSPPMSFSVTLSSAGLMTSPASISSYELSSRATPKRVCSSRLRFLAAILASRCGSSLSMAHIMMPAEHASEAPKSSSSCHSFFCCCAIPFRRLHEAPPRRARPPLRANLP
mmetsp:Transcript_11486/g.28947  ORF Transcript_11486/g.28947 Transcript_11486/m.28947 type:complete len:339 (+) Transcript_11486:2181-3197(+)